MSFVVPMTLDEWNKVAIRSEQELKQLRELDRLRSDYYKSILPTNDNKEFVFIPKKISDNIKIPKNNDLNNMMCIAPKNN